eukprot:TRINITY_DN67990_c0_g1_i1.p1 TRINITY_DN67990_c0_g1~~TRINITY_DN67990_c0_g1_i1.p1  ORF type:complete len:717 (-),score=172.36 TRINITY_DN67990_c0_g1_i1:461-2611(-)
MFRRFVFSACLVVAALGNRHRHLRAHITADSAQPDVSISFALSEDTHSFDVSVDAPTVTGWSAFGFSRNGGMRGADIALLLEDVNAASPAAGSSPTAAVNGYRIVDMVSDDYVMPKTDTAHHWRLLRVTRNGTHTSWTARRAVDTGDAEDIAVTIGLPMYVIYAYGSTRDFVQHGPSSVGTIQVVIGKPFVEVAVESQPPVPGLEVVSVHMSNYTVPRGGDGNTYVCRAFEVPATLWNTTTQRWYTYGMFPDIRTHLVHHTILFGCDADAPFVAGDTFPCFAGVPKCFQMLSGWAPGGSGEWMPTNTAMGTVGLVVMQMHYFNPLAETVVDASGFRLHVTSQPPPVEAGILILGVPHGSVSGSYPIVLPPRRDVVSVTAVCPAAYSDLLPEEGVTVAGVLLHMHTRGERAQLDLVRDGQAIPVAREAPYDFNFQANRPVANATALRAAGDAPVPVRMMRGDSWRLRCDYGTIGERYPVLGGEGTHEEMCYGFVRYYPAIATGAMCFSVPVSDSLADMVATALPGMNLTGQWVAVSSPAAPTALPVSGQAVMLVSEQSYAVPSAPVTTSRLLAAAANGEGVATNQTAGTCAGVSAAPSDDDGGDERLQAAVIALAAVCVVLLCVCVVLVTVLVVRTRQRYSAAPSRRQSAAGDFNMQVLTDRNSDGSGDRAMTPRKIQVGGGADRRASVSVAAGTRAVSTQGPVEIVDETAPAADTA